MNQRNTTQASCKLCRNDRVKVLYRSRRYGFHVGRCPGCGLTFVLDRPTEEQLREMYGDEQDCERYSDLISNAKVRERHVRTLREIRQFMPGSPVPARLFDVGAGSGEFLSQAREFGFEIYGNELSDVAIRLARQRFGVVLSSLSLEQEGRGGFFDVITMWALLEHVLDPLPVIRDAFRILRPGGVAYIYTPAWCAYDSIGLWFALLSRRTLLLDRRITLAHLQLLSTRAMRMTLAATGFELLKMDVVCEYNLPVTAYLESMLWAGRRTPFLGVPKRVRRHLAAALDWLIDRGLFFRNNMRVFCRKPLA